jgi:hypothetical protein
MKRLLGSIGALALLLTGVDTARCDEPGTYSSNCRQARRSLFDEICWRCSFADDCGPCGPNGHCGPNGYCGDGRHGHFGHGHHGHLHAAFGAYGDARLGGIGPGTGGPFGYYQGGPATPTVAYPYYTVRGPRDFLSPNPRGIGP